MGHGQAFSDTAAGAAAGFNISPWQRGTNENTNRLPRHWFAKSTDLSVYTARDLKRVQDSLNNRRRPTLDLATPKQKFNELLLAAAA